MKINAIDAASLRYLITIDAPVDEQDSYGAPVRTWVEFAAVHADIQPLRGQELIALQTIHGVVDAKFIMRYDAITAQITEQHRIRYADVVYNILPPINPAQRGVRLEINARTGLNDG